MCYVEEPNPLRYCASKYNIFLPREEVQNTTRGAGRQLGEPWFWGQRCPECCMTERDGIIEELSTLVFSESSGNYCALTQSSCIPLFLRHAHPCLLMLVGFGS